MEGNAKENEEWPVTSVHDPSRTKMKTDRHSSTNRENSNGLNEPSRMRKFRNGVTFHAKKDSISSDEKLGHGDETDSDDVDRILIELIRSLAFSKSRYKGKNGGTKAPAKTSGRGKGSTESQRINATRERTDNISASTSNEVFEDILRRLQQQEDGGRSVLNRLNKQMSGMLPKNGSESGYEELDFLRNIFRDVLRKQGESKNMSEGQLDGNRRGIMGTPPSLQESLNMNSEDEDAAIEEVSERF